VSHGRDDAMKGLRVARISVLVLVAATLCACSRTENAKTGQALGEVKATDTVTDAVNSDTLNAAARDADAATRDAEHDAAEVKNAAETTLGKAAADVKSDVKAVRDR
jgi:ABC-type uncharacterized transport system auxiliary subunit